MDHMHSLKKVELFWPMNIRKSAKEKIVRNPKKNRIELDLSLF